MREENAHLSQKIKSFQEENSLVIGKLKEASESISIITNDNQLLKSENGCLKSEKLRLLSDIDLINGKLALNEPHELLKLKEESLSCFHDMQGLIRN